MWPYIYNGLTQQLSVYPHEGLVTRVYICIHKPNNCLLTHMTIWTQQVSAYTMYTWRFNPTSFSLHLMVDTPPPPPANNVSIHIWWFQPNKCQPLSRSTHFSLHTRFSTQQISAYTYGGFNPTIVSLHTWRFYFNPTSFSLQGRSLNKVIM